MSALIRCLLLSLGLLASPVLAHTLAPSLLEIRPAEAAKDGQYEVLWRVDLLTPAMDLQWPAHCQRGSSSLKREQRQLDTRYALQCQRSIDGGTLHIQGMHQSRSAILLRRLDTDPMQEHLIHAREPSHRFESNAQGSSVLLRYLWLGLEHILAGPDHLLLVLALFWLARGVRQLLALSLCFTLGHSLTLLLASLGWLSLPSAWVELCIAATLLWLALQMQPITQFTQTPRHQLLVFSGFGLIHGLGFAGALADIGLQSDALLGSLLSFNLGIELGQLAFLAVLQGLVHGLLHHTPKMRHVSWLASRYGIGAMACYWCLDRGLLLLK